MPQINTLNINTVQSSKTKNAVLFYNHVSLASLTLTVCTHHRKVAKLLCMILKLRERHTDDAVVYMHPHCKYRFVTHALR